MPPTAPPPSRSRLLRGGGAPPRAVLRAAGILAALALGVVGIGSARAQTLTFAAGFAASEATSGVTARLAASDVRTAGGIVAAGLVLSPAPGVDLAVRDARALGALGTLTFEVDAGARLTAEGLRARAALVARGGIGPVAGRVRARVWSAPPERFDLLSDPGLVRAGAGASLLVAADGRLDRTWLLGGETRFELGSDGALSVDLRSEVRGRRLLAPMWDGVARVTARVAGSGAGRVGVAAGFVHTPRRAPEVGATAHLDVAPVDGGGLALRPGVEGYGSTSLAGGRLEFRARLRPGAAERAPLFASAGFRMPTDDGAWRLSIAALHGPRTGSAAAASLAYERPLVLP